MSGERSKELAEEVFDKYRRFINPGLAALLKFMGFDSVELEAEGAVVRDIEGREFLDFLGGFGTFALGHRPPQVVAAVREQLDKMPLSSKILFNQPQADLAELLAEITPGKLQYSFFCNSGTEAVEGALKLARLSTGKPEIIATQGAFHGKTLGALSASGREVYKKPFEPLLPGFVHVPFGDASAVQNAITDQTAAVILEPIQGEAGVIIPPDDYLPRVRQLCHDRGVLLILDEVQTGLGRTGKMFACQHWEVAPDIMTLAKALGGGVMPLGAFISTEEIWKSFEPNPLLHSSTFGGNPLACVAGIAALQVIRDDNLPVRATELGEYLMGKLQEIARSRPDMIQEVRGKGLLVGIQFSHEDIAGLVIAGLAQRGIIAAYTLNNPQVIRFEPPLVVSEQQLDRAVQALEESIDQTQALLAEQ